jgi:hypothetical protein
MTRHVVRLQGNESLQTTIVDSQETTILDFWQWAFSDLQMNDIRGIFAEWLVAKLLDIPLDVRDSWQEWDLTTREGVKIEVKTSAYLQAWAQKRPSTLKFSGLKGRKLNGEDNSYAAEATYNADLYVFCVQVEKDPLKWDALDLDQWQFYMLRRAELAELDQKTLSLGPLAKMCPPMDAAGFRWKARAEIETIAKTVGSD